MADTYPVTRNQHIAGVFRIRRSEDDDVFREMVLPLLALGVIVIAALAALPLFV